MAKIIMPDCYEQCMNYNPAPESPPAMCLNHKRSHKCVNLKLKGHYPNDSPRCFICNESIHEIRDKDNVWVINSMFPKGGRLAHKSCVKLLIADYIGYWR